MINILANFFFNEFWWLLIHVTVYLCTIIAFVWYRDLWLRKIDNSKCIPSHYKGVDGYKTTKWFAFWLFLALLSISVCFIWLIDRFNDIYRNLECAPIKDYVSDYVSNPDIENYLLLIFVFPILYGGPVFLSRFIWKLVVYLKYIKQEIIIEVEAKITDIRREVNDENSEWFYATYRYKVNGVEYAVEKSYPDGKEHISSMRFGLLSKKIHIDMNNPTKFAGGHYDYESFFWMFKIIFAVLMTFYGDYIVDWLFFKFGIIN